MNNDTRGYLATIIAFTLGALFLVLFALNASASSEEQVCAGFDSGKIDTPDDPANITVSAPDGFLIDGYCVKAGAPQSGDGPVFVVVDPPQKTVTITYPSGKDISHYALSWIKDQTTTTTSIPTTTTTTASPTTTVPETTTTTIQRKTTTTNGEESTTTTNPQETTTSAPSSEEKDPSPTTTEAPSTSATLPFTGVSEIAGYSILGLVLLSIGGLIIAATRTEE